MLGAEQGIANWISQFLNVYHGIDPKILGAATISDFWGLMTLGGIIGLILLKIFDSRWVLITLSGLAMICLILALFGPAEIALICFPLTGFIFIGNVSHSFFFDIEFLCRPSRFNFRNIGHGNYWRSHLTAHHWLVRRCGRTSVSSVLFIFSTCLYFEYWFLSKAPDH